MERLSLAAGAVSRAVPRSLRGGHPAQALVAERRAILPASPVTGGAAAAAARVSAGWVREPGAARSRPTAMRRRVSER